MGGATETEDSHAKTTRGARKTEDSHAKTRSHAQVFADVARETRPGMCLDTQYKQNNGRRDRHRGQSCDRPSDRE